MIVGDHIYLNMYVYKVHQHRAVRLSGNSNTHRQKYINNRDTKIRYNHNWTKMGQSEFTLQQYVQQMQTE